MIDWYKFKLDEIREAPVDSRPRKLSRLCQISEKNKHLGVTITRAETINPVNYPGYPPELKLHEYEDNIRRSIIIRGNKKIGVNRLNPVQKATYFLKKSKVGKMKNVQ